jgi:hypothetical protein
MADVVTAKRAERVKNVIQRVINLIAFINDVEAKVPHFEYETKIDEKSGPEFLAMLQTAQTMGTPIRVADVYNALGLAPLKPGDLILQGAQGFAESKMLTPFALPVAGAATTAGGTGVMGNEVTGNTELALPAATGAEILPEMGGMPEIGVPTIAPAGTETLPAITPLSPTPGAASRRAGLDYKPLNAGLIAAEQFTKTEKSVCRQIVTDYLLRNNDVIFTSLSNTINKLIAPNDIKRVGSNLRDFRDLLQNQDEVSLTRLRNIGFTSKDIIDALDATWKYGWLRAFMVNRAELIGKVAVMQPPSTIGKLNEVDALFQSQVGIQDNKWQMFKNSTRLRASQLMNKAINGLMDDIIDLVDRAELVEFWKVSDLQLEIRKILYLIDKNRKPPECLKSIFMFAINQGYIAGQWNLVNSPDMVPNIYGFKMASSVSGVDYCTGHSQANGYVGTLQRYRSLGIAPLSMPECKCGWTIITMAEAKQAGWAAYNGDYPSGSWVVTNSEPIKEFPVEYEQEYQQPELIF